MPRRPAVDKTLHLVFQKNPLPMWIFDIDTLRFLDVNEAALRVYGHTRQQFLRMKIADIRPTDQLPKFLKAVKRKYNRVENVGEWMHRTRKGRIFPVQVTTYPTHFKGRKAVLSIIRDLSDRKRGDDMTIERDILLQREKQLRAQAETAGRAKDEFLAVISHELRTPMTAMLGWTWLLRSRPLDQQLLNKALEVMERNMNLQAQVIEDLLDVSSLITGKMSLDMQPVDIARLIAASVDTIRPACQTKLIDLDADIAAETGMILGDSARLTQIIWNLLANAVKFTPSGGRVKVTAQIEGKDVVITVADTGIGIEPSFIPFLFERFRQAEASITREHRGLGLGLALVKNLVELHGGSVKAQSKGINQGSAFHIRLPATKIAKADTTPLPPPPPPKAQRSAARMQFNPLHRSLEGVDVLVVDDEIDNREMIKAVLEHYGATVRAVSCAKNALEALQARQPTVLISDISMPEEDGYCLIRKIRALPAEKGGKVPAAALTAYTKAEDRARSLIEGFNLYLSKPFVPLELAAAVGRLAGSAPILPQSERQP